LSNIHNAKEIYFLNDTKYESSANISCDKGFNVKNQTQTKDISSTVVKCKENGKWEKLPTCVKKGKLYGISFCILIVDKVIQNYASFCICESVDIKNDYQTVP
jgi:hypothetical protein